MKITNIGTDLISVDEDSIENGDSNHQRVHLIKLAFKNPTNEKVQWVLHRFPDTNRYIISDNIKFYNGILRTTNKKYYIINKEGDQLITFFKRNNKVLLDITKLSEVEKIFVLDVALEDVLRNTEVMIAPKEDYEERKSIFNSWRGNLVIYDSNYNI